MHRLTSMMALSLMAGAGCRPVLPNAEVDVDEDTTGGVHEGTTGDGTTEAPASTGPERTEVSGSGSGGAGSGSPGVTPPPPDGLESSGSGTETTESTESTETTESTTGSTQCGDDVLEDPEACDGPDLGGVACTDLGFLGGDLACAADCTHDPTPCIQSPAVGSLFFSEYVEGTGTHKALEIYVTSDSPVALDTCEIRLYSNENETPVVTLPLEAPGPVGGHDVFLVCQESLSHMPECDQRTSQGLFSGDDAIELACGGVTLDTFGQIGHQPPGLEWWNQVVPTTAVTLRRDCGVSTGDTNGFNLFDSDLEWDPYALDDFTDLGQHVCP